MSKAYVVCSNGDKSKVIKIFLSKDKANNFVNKLNETLKIRYFAENAALNAAGALPKGQNNPKFDEVFFFNKKYFVKQNDRGTKNIK